MARTTIEEKAISKALAIGRLTKLSQQVIIGYLVMLWHHSQDQGLEIVNREWMDAMVLNNTRRRSTKDSVIKQFTAMRFIEDLGDDQYRIKGNSKHIANLISFKEKTKKARKAKAENTSGVQMCVVKQQLDDTKFGAVNEHSEVIHIDGSKALLVEDSENKTKQNEFEKSSVDRDVDSSLNSLQLQLQLQLQNNNKKEKINKKKDDSTKSIDSEKRAAATSALHFLTACQKFKEKFKSHGVTIGPNAQARYAKLIAGGVTHDQVLAMIENYASLMLPQVKPGFNPIKRKFETFLGNPKAWFCLDYLEPVECPSDERGLPTAIQAMIERTCREDRERIAQERAESLRRHRESLGKTESGELTPTGNILNARFGW